MRKLRIGNRVITDASKAFVIAEIGSNHGGDMDLAERLVRAAAACGCDAVKFQKRNNRELYTEAMYNKPYDNENSYGKTYGLHREALELNVEQHLFLKDLAESLGMIYFSTPFDFTSVDEMEMLGVGLYKVASGDIYSYPLLKRIGETKKPVILSTGGADIPEIRAALDHIGHGNVAILHCVASYPCSPEQCNLMAINTLSRAFPDHIIGLSDHYGGILSSVAAWMMGGRIFEKHFKIDGCRGTDVAFSLDPHKMLDLVDDLSTLPRMIGDGIKRRLPEENDPLYKMGKGIYAKCDIDQDEVLDERNLCIKSPCDGLRADNWYHVCGRRSLRPIRAGSGLSHDDLGGELCLKV